MTPPQNGGGTLEKIVAAANEAGIDLTQFELQRLNQAWVRAVRETSE